MRLLIHLGMSSRSVLDSFAQVVVVVWSVTIYLFPSESHTVTSFVSARGRPQRWPYRYLLCNHLFWWGSCIMLCDTPERCDDTLLLTLFSGETPSPPPVAKCLHGYALFEVRCLPP